METVGTPLTESEVLEIRDGAISIALPRGQHTRLIGTRGYRDIDPDNAWTEWQQLRSQFNATD